MARLRLFANLREIAGATHVDVDGTTVAEVLEGAVTRFGGDFARALETAQVWVDGDRVSRTASVGADSEVAIIPPVSGGATVVQSPIFMEIGMVAAFFVALFFSNHIGIEAFTVALVFIAALWAFDVVASADRRGLPLAGVPILLGVGAGAIATYRFGIPGMAAAVVGAVVLTLVASVVSGALRPVDSFAAASVLAMITAFGSSALVLMRLRSREETLVFLFVLTIAVLVSWLSDRSEMPVLDPLVALLVGAVLAGAIGGALWAPAVVDAVAASVAAAIALVAGRNLGMLLRAGGFFVQGPIPGSLSYFDGALLAAGAFWTILAIMG